MTNLLHLRDKGLGSVPTVVTYGTFDLFHVGHVRLLKRARALGSRLLVGVSTDEFNAKKGKRSVNSFLERCEVVAACQYVDGVFAEDCWQQKTADILRLDASIFTIGDDWKGHFDFLSKYCDVIYIPRTEGISTTLIKNKHSEMMSAGW
ncbi:adenylyltransferase/cytidyltransferase family protein [Novacetimonas pomaceti]|uniref:adenylyltransferase/cytidyltransferase family protein n=1 Tax=Novacetimonas pomaceti TaxID=2021998 RepID=UPI001EEFBD12|nr:adenylyltransferase/cytidyltransferase family protein [Novacetimonas pomaceti]